MNAPSVNAFPVRRAFSLPKAGHAPAENEDAWAGPLAEASAKASGPLSALRALRAAIADGATESAFAGVWARVLAEASMNAPPACFEAPEASSPASADTAEASSPVAEGPDLTPKGPRPASPEDDESAPPDALWQGLLREAREAFAREVGPRLAGLPWYAAAKAEDGAHATLLAFRIEASETEPVSSAEPPEIDVIPAEAGIHAHGGENLPRMDLRLRGEDMTNVSEQTREELANPEASEGAGGEGEGGAEVSATPLEASDNPAKASAEGGGTWQALAVGDAVLFHLRAGALVQAWPLDTPEAFSNRPPLVSSRPGRGPEPLRAQGTWQAGDAFALVTDALAAHLLATRPADALAPDTAEAFAEFVARAREAGMRNDDVTLVVLSPLSPRPPSSRPEPS